MTQYFDTHAHYDSGKFNADRDEVLRAVHDSGVALVVDPGDSGVTSERAVALAQAHDFVYAAVGWHPEEADSWTDSSLAGSAAEGLRHRRDRAGLLLGRIHKGKAGTDVPRAAGACA